MRCVSPLYRIDAVLYRDWINNFAPGIKRCGYLNKGYILNGYTLKTIVPEESRYRFDEIPCGRCINCRLNRQREWALRCTLEAKRWPNNLFVTLTYDDAHLPIYPYSDDNVSELRKRDLQLFIKRLRERLRIDFDHVGLRYFACGEYGELSDRAHYHVILFNLPDLPLHQIGSSSGFPMFSSDVIEKAWCDSEGLRLGFVSLAEFSTQTASYVAGYVLKKKLGKERITWSNRLKLRATFAGIYCRPHRALKLVRGFSRSRQEPFLLMSLKPGIGYVDDLQKVIHDDAIVLNAGGKAVQTVPFRYLKKVADRDPELSDHLLFIAQERRSRRDGMYLSDKDINDNLHRISAAEVKRSQLRRRLL